MRKQQFIYQTHQIREFERLAEERFAISGVELMQRAGKAAFDFMLKRWPQARKISVFCGSGNNGGDGYVLAQLASDSGFQVTIWQVGEHDDLSFESQQALVACKNRNIDIIRVSADIKFDHPDLIVDAICGIGLRDRLREETCALIEKINQINAPIYALDVPTGIEADTGELLGVAIRATATMTFMGLKLGLLTAHGTAYAGEVVLNDLQIPNELIEKVEPSAEKIDISSLKHWLTPRSKDCHKGMTGHVLVIGGALGYSGAPRMAGEAALRVGAGLVSIATQPENAVVMNVERPELMCHGVSKPDELLPLLAKADVIVLGPGLGQSPWSAGLWTAVLAQEKPLVVDADGLNLLAIEKDYRNSWVLTPHPGEAARLLNETSQVVQQDRLVAIKEVVQRFGGTCVLKGAGTLIATDDLLPSLCDKGNPGMASAGMGDILSGVIGGLMAQGVPAADAAKLGVYLHAQAGDMAAKDGERGIIATDLLPHLHHLCNSLGSS